MTGAAISIDPLTGGDGTVLLGSLADVDLATAGYVETEWRCAGTASSYTAPAGLGADGRWSLVEGGSAPFSTRVVVRAPEARSRASRTLVVEWLNVSSGTDAAPVFGFAGPEIVRSGHTWVGVSAQWAGVVSAPALVDVGGPGLVALQDADPVRYGALHHPGDAYCFDLFTGIVDGLVAGVGPFEPGWFDTVVAVGESQSAYALTTYVNGFLPSSGRFDGVLIHSRGGPPMPLGEPDRGVDLEAGRHDPAVLIRDDLDVPVLVLQTETDVLGHLDSLAARQPDTDLLRLWEVAGSAHADRSLIGDFEEFLGCDEPVNRGQQRFVVRCALRHLVGWAAGGSAPPSAERLDVVVAPAGVRGEEDPAPDDRDGIRRRSSYALDDVGNVTGGVRTPCVDAPVEVLSGLCGPGASHVCQLFGRRLPAPTDVLRRRYPTVGDYETAYATATDDAIAAGFVLAEDRDEVLADAHPELITW